MFSRKSRLAGIADSPNEDDCSGLLLSDGEDEGLVNNDLQWGLDGPGEDTDLNA